MVIFFVVQAGLDIAINRLNQLSINVVGLATLPSTNNSFIVYQISYTFSFSSSAICILTHTRTHTHTCSFNVSLTGASLYKVKYLCMM